MEENQDDAVLTHEDEDVGEGGEPGLARAVRTNWPPVSEARPCSQEEISGPGPCYRLADGSLCASCTLVQRFALG